MPHNTNSIPKCSQNLCSLCGKDKRYSIHIHAHINKNQFNISYIDNQHHGGTRFYVVNTKIAQPLDHQSKLKIFHVFVLVRVCVPLT